MKTKFHTTSFFLLISFSLFSQKNTLLTGLVADSTGTGLPAASVVLLENKDSALVAFGITEADGRFALKRVLPGDYLLQISYVGYDTEWVPVAVVVGQANSWLKI